MLWATRGDKRFGSVMCQRALWDCFGGAIPSFIGNYNCAENWVIICHQNSTIMQFETAPNQSHVHNTCTQNGQFTKTQASLSYPKDTVDNFWPDWRRYNSACFVPFNLSHKSPTSIRLSWCRRIVLEIRITEGRLKVLHSVQREKYGLEMEDSEEL